MLNQHHTFRCLVHAVRSNGFDNVVIFCGDLLAWTDATNERCGLVDCATGMVVEVPIEDIMESRHDGWYVWW